MVRFAQSKVASAIVWGAFTNAGQACASIERLYILKGKKTDQLIEKIVEKTKALKVGPATDGGPSHLDGMIPGEYLAIAIHPDDYDASGLPDQ